MSPRRANSHVFAPLLCALVLPLLLPANAAAFRVETREDSTVEVTNGLAAFPARAETKIKPGEVKPFEIGFQNRFGKTITVIVKTRDLGSSPELPQNPINILDEATFGASDWVSVDRDRFELEHGQIGWIIVTARAPENATPGSYYAVVLGEAGVTQQLGRPGAKGSVAGVGAGVGAQIFFDIPGERIYKGEVTRVGIPRVSWRDKGSYIPIDVVYRNDGNVTDRVGGRVAWDGLFGNDVARQSLTDAVVLRGGAREYRALWTDPPWIGRFTPKLQVRGRGGKIEVRELDPIWIIPSWKYIAMVLGALSLPLLYHLVQRRRLRRLRYEVEASRAIDSEDHDEDW